MKFLYALRYIHTAAKLAYGAVLAITLTYEILKYRRHEKQKRILLGNYNG